MTIMPKLSYNRNVIFNKSHVTYNLNRFAFAPVASNCFRLPFDLPLTAPVLTDVLTSSCSWLKNCFEDLIDFWSADSIT